LLCLVFMSAGVTWGLDGRIAESHPRWRLVFAGAGGRWRT
jgi:hypothetical protein